MTKPDESMTVRGVDTPETIENLDAAGPLVLDRASSIVSAGMRQLRFRGGSHQCETEANDSGVLILEAKSKGDVWYSFDGYASEHTLRSGTLHYIPPGIEQQYDFRGECDTIATTVSSEAVDMIAEANPEFSGVRLDQPLRAFARPQLARLIEEQNRLVRAGELGWRSLADANMIRLTVELMTLVSDRRTCTALPMSAHELGQIDEYLRAEIGRNVPLSEISELVGRDVFGFCRGFKTATGETFHQYAMKLRLDLARRMLVETSMPLAEVAFATGFSSQQHFTTAMSKHCGISPGRLRREVGD